MKKYIIILITIIYCTSCVEEFDLKLKGDEPRLMVEGLITNRPGPYFVRLTYSKQDISSGSVEYEAVNNAFVVISDNKGTADTLIPAQPYECYQYIYDDDNITIIDSVKKKCNEDLNEKGYYQTTNIKGIIGYTYTLQVEANGKTYTASDYMPDVPDIDSLAFTEREGEKSETILSVPLLYFKEPEEDNFYLFRIGQPSNIPISSDVYSEWAFSILSDELLPGYVSGLSIASGTSPDKRDLIYRHQTGLQGDIIVTLNINSLSAPAYYYYMSLIKQFDNDGGAYSPSPASTQGNISNSGLGFFRASGVSIISDNFNNILPMKR